MVDADKILMGLKGVEKSYKIEWGWMSYKVGDKMIAAICTPSEKYDEKYANRPLLTLKCDTMEGEILKNQFEDILKGFYMDSRFWISLRLDGDVPLEMIEKLCENSYNLVFNKLSKKLQAEINNA